MLFNYVCVHVMFFFFKSCFSALVIIEAAKSLLCSAPVLAAPDFSRPFQLEVDASAVSVSAGAVPQFEDGV